MKKTLVTICICYTLTVNAQNYLIYFAGTGASTIVTSVKVENLNAGTFLTLNGNDVLHLTGTTDIYSPENKQSSGIRIYPNPMTENSLIEVEPPVEGEAVIAIYDLTGRQLIQRRDFIEKTGQGFRLSGLKDGLYLISVKGARYQISEQLLSKTKSGGNISIEKVNGNTHSGNGKKLKTDCKGVQTTVDMQYTTGDILKFTGTSGIYSTVITEIPLESKTITFNFVTCTDGDGNNYSVVQIGNQTWMAENLKTTKYNDLTSIPLVIENLVWSQLTTPSYSWYNHDESANKNAYGALYNWFTVNTGKLCPTGWHVPNETEWMILFNYLGGLTVAGGKLKESGTTHWSNPNESATNITGFTALPGGSRGGNGNFFYLGNLGIWWTSTWDSLAKFFQTDSNNDDIYGSNSIGTVGYSVRCLKN